MKDQPEPKFKQFERVITVGDPFVGTKYLGQEGIILWRDLVKLRREPGGPREPRRIYVVEFPSQECCLTCNEWNLSSTGQFDPAEAHLGKGYEISFDTILEDDSRISGGSFRMPGKFWHVFVVERDNVTELRYRMGNRRSGIGCVDIQVPQSVTLSQRTVIEAMNVVFGEVDWKIVYGPDSLILM